MIRTDRIEVPAMTARPAQPRTTSGVALAVLGSALLTACVTVGPDYQTPPPVTIGDGWAQPVVASSRQADLARWWSTLGDPVLERLIDTALSQNLDMRLAAARIDESRALRDRVAGGRAPVVTAGASVNRRRQSENGSLPINSIPGLDATQTIYDAGFDAAWEIDVFGANRRALESAEAKVEAAEAEAQGVRMRIVAEVARAWFTAVGAGDELRTQRATLNTLRETLELARQRLAAGDASDADVDAVYAQWAAASALLPDIQARRHAAVLSLGVLLGEPPERELALLDAGPSSLNLLPLPVGERADVLRRRPDVLAAERRVAASTADIGVATAELFPKLSIGAGGGFQALSTGDWFDASSTRFSVLPLISWRVFDGGRVRAEIRAREAAERQAALAYEQTVLTALGDAERTLSDYHASLDTLVRRWVALDANHRNHDHARARYAAGDISLIELLAAERLLHEAETAAVHAHTTAAIQLVALYKALGGGWDAPATAPVSIGPDSAAAVPVARGAGAGSAHRRSTPPLLDEKRPL